MQFNGKNGKFKLNVDVDIVRRTRCANTNAVCISRHSFKLNTLLIVLFDLH